VVPWALVSIVYIGGVVNLYGTGEICAGTARGGLCVGIVIAWLAICCNASYLHATTTLAGTYFSLHLPSRHPARPYSVYTNSGFSTSVKSSHS